MADFSLLPARTALVNVDMQRCFVEGSPLASPHGRALLDTVNGLIRTCRPVSTAAAARSLSPSAAA